MENLKDLDRENHFLLDAIGAEPLMSSGFEGKQSEPEFDSTEHIEGEE